MMQRSRREECLRVLRDVFHVEAFRPGQEQTVEALLDGRDVLCTLPTGAGKSLCYQLPAVMLDGWTIVASPLLALMRDQALKLRSLGIPAAMISSDVPPEEQADILNAVRQGRLRVLFVSPERIAQARFADWVRACPPRLLVVDEAHCVVRWGETFRPSYQSIGPFAASLPERPVICAMTATADGKLAREIIRSLAIRRPRRVMLAVLRENLNYRVIGTANRAQTLERIVRMHHGERMIIYCTARSRTEQLARMLQEAGVPAACYHAGMETARREAVQHAFTQGETKVIAATIAFGMGVDVPDVRCIVHDGLPESVIDYVQQTGRAGRDGKPAECVTLLSPEALLERNRRLHAQKRDARGDWRREIRYLRARRETMQLLRLLMGGGCIRQGISRAFDQRSEACGACSACTTAVTGDVPPIAAMTGTVLLRWILRHAREQLAKERGVSPRAVASDEALRRMATAGCILPDMRLDERTNDVFTQILASFRHA